jgi:L-ascorbate metabolism protein UlaG (beta-lactamase superfamily)
MNRAHSTHYTLFPDPRIPHVLHGWRDDGQPAKISEHIGDVYIRNVTTDIRRFYGDDSGTDMIKDGNSIFIFEVAGLCIGHLGHLHVKLDDTHFAAIGRLDIVMVPIDGTYTMSLDGISDITRRLHAAVVLPMHRFATPLQEFMERIGKDFEIDRRSERSLRISRETLPTAPTVIILDGV